MNEQPLFPMSVLDRVREGMSVIDPNGRGLGRITSVQLGGPEASVPDDPQATQENLEGGVAVAPLEDTAGAIGINGPVPLLGGGLEAEPDMPDELRTELRRTGYIVVDGAHLHGPERYIAADRIADVSGETVHLRPGAGAE